MLTKFAKLATIILLIALAQASGAGLHSTLDHRQQKTPEKLAAVTDPQLTAAQELQKELCSAPINNSEREQAMFDLFIQAGALPDQIHRDPIYPDNANQAYNVYLIKPGRARAVIVVGGHIDHVDVGQGIIDDWTGACAVANIYKAIKNIETNHTIIFIGFAGEEKGLVGSKSFVEHIKPEELPLYRAMINLECLGTAESNIWINGSDKELAEPLHTVATRDQIPLHDHILNGVAADSNSFRNHQIPALTMDGLPEEKFSLIHSAKDQCENVDQKSYYDAYRLAVDYLLELDRSIKPLNNK